MPLYLCALIAAKGIAKSKVYAALRNKRMAP